MHVKLWHVSCLLYTYQMIFFDTWFCSCASLWIAAATRGVSTSFLRKVSPPKWNCKRQLKKVLVWVILGQNTNMIMGLANFSYFVNMYICYFYWELQHNHVVLSPHQIKYHQCWCLHSSYAMGISPTDSCPLHITIFLTQHQVSLEG
jgi:hypothetical protein